MRVLHLATHLNTGGITTYILRLVRPLREHGVEISVLSSGGECTPSFQALQAPVFELPFRTKSELSPKLYRTLPALIRLVRENKIDLLHAHTRVTQVLAFWIQRIAGIPFVTTCHGFYKRRLGRRLLPAWGERTIAISLAVEDHLKNDFHVPAARIRRIFNAVNLEEIDRDYGKHHPEQVRVEYGFRREDCVVGVIARLVEDKGHHYLIRAIHALQKDMPQLRLIIVGEGRRKPDLVKLVVELGIRNRVVFTGNVADVTKPLAAMDIFALPATWREGFGLSIIEAIACGKPVIVTNIWALNTLIENGKTGILVEPKRADLLAQAIAGLARDQELRRSIGRQGRKMVETFFTMERMAREIADVYTDKTLTARKPRL